LLRGDAASAMCSMSASEVFNQVEYQEAMRLAIQHHYGSASLLQRQMLLPYKRAKALVEVLTSEGVLTVPTKAGLRLLQPGYVPLREFSASPEDKHVRLLRDLALYLLECEELRGGIDSRCTAMILHPLEISVKELSAAAAGADRGPTPVLAIGLALARLPQLASVFAGEELAAQLRVSCAAFERRPVHVEVDVEERLVSGLAQLARYFEKRLIDGWGAHTRAFECFVRDELLPMGKGHAGGGHREHVVPCAHLRDRCMELLRAGLPPEAAADWMRPYLAIVMITPQQANTLDIVLGLKTRMPAGWRFDFDCIFDRLHEAGIAFDAPAGHGACLH
jgi:hypothetical protein